jgi:hypothetical protein
VSRSRHLPATDDLPIENVRARIARLEADREAAEAERRELRQAVELLAHLLTKAGQRIAAAETPRQRADSFVPIAEAAERAGLSVKTLRRLVERGVIQGAAVRATGTTRRRWLVSCASLAAFLATRVQGNRAPCAGA